LAKYRLLNAEELQELEKEFIDFLVLNGITADDWVKVKKDQAKADRMVELFSDVVFEKILRQINYLKHVSKSSIKTFHCQEDSIHLIGIDSDDPELDLSSIEILKTDSTSKHLKIYQASKSYHPTREEELYRMLESGCLKSDGSVYKMLEGQLSDED